jgi:hypothetical protein
MVLFSGSALGRAGASLVEERAKAEATRAEQVKAEGDRVKIGQEAVTHLREILDGLIDRIQAIAPFAQTPDKDMFLMPKISYAVRLGQGSLAVTDFWTTYRREGAKPFNRYGWDAITGTLIWVQSPSMEPHVQAWPWHKASANGRGASLVFGELVKDEGYRWWEVTFCNSQGTQPVLITYPEELEDVELAHNPRIIDGEHTHDFYERWSTWLAKCAQGQLDKPHSLLEESIDSKFLP